ncbi:MAG: tRNA (adenosine(37)-N6)-threonylcarbamoyltransferase complex transferase subunit TsaD [Planctomycetota bacterium]
MTLVLAIESSCDESSVALVAPGPKVVAEATLSQDALHGPWGGIVPELASRAHQERLAPLVANVLQKAGKTLRDVTAVASASQPGLLGPLLVGVTLGQTLAWSLGVPFLGINHLLAHMHSVELEDRKVPEGSLGLLVSGGHTLLLVLEGGGWRILGGTRDDAAGEAFDKGARLLGLPYPGGALLSKLASAGDRSRLKFPVAEAGQGQMSFSGLKSELRRRVEAGILGKERKEDVAAGYEEAIIQTLLKGVEECLKATHGPGKVGQGGTLVVSGGVSRNAPLREAMLRCTRARGMSLLLPEDRWCTDNAAMIGAAAMARVERGESDGLMLEPSPRVDPRELMARGSL